MVNIVILSIGKAVTAVAVAALVGYVKGRYDESAKDKDYKN